MSEDLIGSPCVSGVDDDDDGDTARPANNVTDVGSPAVVLQPGHLLAFSTSGSLLWSPSGLNSKYFWVFEEAAWFTPILDASPEPGPCEEGTSVMLT